MLFQHHQLMRSGEYDDKLINSGAPIELRRPGSGPPRTISVPHSLQSPQDRTAAGKNNNLIDFRKMLYPTPSSLADSPQMAQVYVHNTRIPHAHFSEMAQRGGYYENAGIQLEPPPAHRAASISVVVPPPQAGSPYLSGGATVSVSVQPGAHPSLHPSQAKLLEREREQRERENERLSMVAAVGEYLPAVRRQLSTVRNWMNRNTDLEQPCSPFTAKQQEHILHGGIEMPGQQQPPQQQQQTPPPQGIVPPPGDSLVTLLQRYPVMWQGLLALKTDQAAVQMHFVHGNPNVARAALPALTESTTPLLRIAQRMRLEQTQLEGVAKKMQVCRDDPPCSHCIPLIFTYQLHYLCPPGRYRTLHVAGVAMWTGSCRCAAAFA